MGHGPFSKPILLTLSAGRIFQARTPWEALDYLDHYWPSEKGRHFEVARQLCAAAVDGFVAAEVARRAILDTAQRGRALVHTRRRERITAGRRAQSA